VAETTVVSKTKWWPLYDMLLTCINFLGFKMGS